MVEMKCPQCAYIVEGVPGQMAVCGNCGFQAPLPIQGAVAPPAAEVPEGPEAMKSPSVWAYVSSLAALGMFFLAGFVLPFLLAITGIGLGFMSHLRDRADHRGMMAMVVGCFALVACATFLAV